MAFDLQGAVDKLTDPHVPIYLKAIKLFELQAFIFWPRDEVRWRNARLFAALKMLELIENEVKQKHGRISIRDLAARDEYCEVYDTVVLAGGGFLRVRHLPKAREFDCELRVRRIESKAIARCLEFSYRFRPPQGQKKVAGITMAIRKVRTIQELKVRRGRSTLKKRWKEYRPTAAFLFLIHILNFKFKPQRVSSSKFASKLIETVSEVDRMVEFFRSYSEVVTRLEKAGYSFESIAISGSVDSRRLSLPPLRL